VGKLDDILMVVSSIDSKMAAPGSPSNPTKPPTNVSGKEEKKEDSAAFFKELAEHFKPLREIIGVFQKFSKTADSLISAFGKSGGAGNLARQAVGTGTGSAVGSALNAKSFRGIKDYVEGKSGPSGSLDYVLGSAKNAPEPFLRETEASGGLKAAARGLSLGAEAGEGLAAGGEGVEGLAAAGAEAGAAGGPVGIGVAAAVGIAAAIAASPFIITEFNKSLIEGQRAVAEFSGSMAQIVAQHDVFTILQQNRLGEARSDSYQALEDSFEDLSEALEPLTTAFVNLGASLLSNLTELVSILVRLYTIVEGPMLQAMEAAATGLEFTQTQLANLYRLIGGEVAKKDKDNGVGGKEFWTRTRGTPFIRDSGVKPRNP
jgi:hypothetical protein